MERSRAGGTVVFVCTLAVGLCASGQGKTIFVDDDATGTRDGSSWTNAFAHLQDALAVAHAGDEIRVAQGTYRPDRGAGIAPGDREATFALASGVTLAGGYAGLSGDDPEVHDIARYETILSGDLAGDDGPDFANIGDNSIVVVSSLSNDATTVLVGCTITGGWGATGPGVTALDSDLRIERCTMVRNKTRGTRGDGGGMYNSGGAPILKDCAFIDNLAWGDGGGLWNEDGNPTLMDCLFKRNTAEKSGGGLYSRDGTLMLERCMFKENEAGTGGGMYALPGPNSTCVDSQFVSNVSTWYSGGGVCLRGTGSIMTFRRCSFEGNSADNGGGGLDHSAAAENRYDLVLTRCSFLGNKARQGGALSTAYGALSATDCVFADNVASRAGGAVSTRDGGRHVAPGPTGPGPTWCRCRFVGNTARSSHGGGLHNSSSDVTLANCLLAGNDARDGGAIYSIGAGPTLRHCTLAQNWGDDVGGMLDTSHASILDHCILWGNAGDELSAAALVAYSDIEGGWPGEGNIDVDPCFAIPGAWEESGRVRVWCDGDYHLTSRAGRWDSESETWVQDDVTSPCVDAGDPLGSLGDELFPNGGVVNLGAYGGTVEASKSYFGDPICEVHLGGDINGDCAVDFQDLLVVVSQWSEQTLPSVDEGSALAIVEPQEGDTFTVSFGPILILARVHDPTVAVTEVQFHMEGRHAGGHSATSLPGHQGANGWYLLWESVPRRGPSQPEGVYTLTAEATCDDGTSILSAPVTFTLEAAALASQ